MAISIIGREAEIKILERLLHSGLVEKGLFTDHVKKSGGGRPVSVSGSAGGFAD